MQSVRETKKIVSTTRYITGQMGKMRRKIFKRRVTGGDVFRMATATEGCVVFTTKEDYVRRSSKSLKIAGTAAYARCESFKFNSVPRRVLLSSTSMAKMRGKEMSGHRIFDFLRQYFLLT